MSSHRKPGSRGDSTPLPARTAASDDRISDDSGKTAGADLIPERALVERSLQGDLGAFEELIRRYQKAIFNVALYKSRNYFDAEDLTQDIFLAAFRAIGSLKDQSHFGSWLFGIAHNRSNKWFQRQRTKIIKFQELQRRKEREVSGAARAQAEDTPRPEELLAEGMKSLPAEVREVLVLKYLDGETYQTIEARLGINTHRIDYLIRKGKALLREALGGPQGERGEGAD